MSPLHQYRKYQVYFFLYLAVICELLIVIVERDDADENWKREAKALADITRTVIQKLIKEHPTLDPDADTRMLVGDTRFIDIMIRNVTHPDEIVQPPRVVVFREGQVVDTIAFTQDSTRTGNGIFPLSILDQDRLRRDVVPYRLRWTAPQPGRYRFLASAGTNVAGFVGSEPGREMEEVSIAGMTFPTALVQDALNRDGNGKGLTVKDLVEASRTIVDTFQVEVLAKGEKLTITPFSPLLVTAVGIPVSNPLAIGGTTADKVTSILANGTPLRRDAMGWVWQNRFDREGTYTITVQGRDQRGAGELSISTPARFTVRVRQPHMQKRPPRQAFAGEVFEMNLATTGLDRGRAYSWTASIDGRPLATDTGTFVRVRLPDQAHGELRILARYDGQPYVVLPDSSVTTPQPSDFSYTMSTPPVRFANLSFMNGGSYSVRQDFRFTVYRCGRCSYANVRPLERKDIHVTAETESGRDLPIDVSTQIRDLPDGGRQTLVTLHFEQLVHRETEAILTLHVAGVTQTVRVILLPG